MPVGSCPLGVGHGAAEPPTAPAIGMEARRAETRYEVRQPGPEVWPNDQRRTAAATLRNGGNRGADGMARARSLKLAQYQRVTALTVPTKAISIHVV